MSNPLPGLSEFAGNASLFQTEGGSGTFTSLTGTVTSLTLLDSWIE